jgi:multiple sugar transport system ATP-binding protein
MAQIRVENLRKSFDQFTAVHDSDFTIESGDLLCPGAR